MMYRTCMHCFISLSPVGTNRTDAHKPLLTQSVSMIHSLSAHEKLEEPQGLSQTIDPHSHQKQTIFHPLPERSLFNRTVVVKDRFYKIVCVKEDRFNCIEDRWQLKDATSGSLWIATFISWELYSNRHNHSNSVKCVNLTPWHPFQVSLYNYFSEIVVHSKKYNAILSSLYIN